MRTVFGPRRLPEIVVKLNSVPGGGPGVRADRAARRLSAHREERRRRQHPRLANARAVPLPHVRAKAAEADVD